MFNHIQNFLHAAALQETCKSLFHESSSYSIHFPLLQVGITAAEV